MLRHYLVTALRAFARHKLYSLINIMGFAIGLACAILSILYVRDELSYDRWIADTENLYRLETTFQMPGREPMRGAQVPFPVVKAVHDHIPQVQAVTHVMPEQMTVSIEGRQFRETVTAVDPSFFQVIKLPLLQGDPQHVLDQPDSIVISQSTAHKFFGDTDPIGRLLELVMDRNGACEATDSACLSAAYPMVVRGVLRDLPHNSQLLADMIMPNTARADELSAQEKEQDWMSMDGDYGYVKLLPGVAPEAVLAELGPLLDRSFDPKDFGAAMRASELEKLQLTPFRDVHLTSDQYYGMRPAGSWTTIYGVAALALLIVLMACFNFMNLATARATLRAREIALRKLGGATRTHLIMQFLGEAVLMSLLSLLIALAMVDILLPVYDRLVDKPIQLHYITDWKLLAALIAGTIAVGLVSGLYPAVVLAAFRPATALKAGASIRGRPGVLRSVLVIVQFAISIGLAIAALVVFRQIDFARRLDLGFHRDGIVVVRGIERLTPTARDRLAHQLRTSAQIIGVAYSNAAPFDVFATSNPYIGAAGEPPSVAARMINIDPEFPGVYAIRLIAGRLLSEQRGEDLSRRARARNLLLNAAAARRLGFKPEDAIGKSINIGNYTSGQVVGVLSDTNFSGARARVEPSVYQFDKADPHAVTRLSVRLRGERIPEALAFIDQTWRAAVPGAAIDRYFLTDSFDELFRTDLRQGRMLGACVAVAIFIASLGLFGLAVFTAERRTKEIGMRKLCGARMADIVQRLLWQISIPVLIANAIAWPVAYLYLTHWLQGYAQRISLSPAYFLAAGAVALIIAWATVFAHVVRLAHATPIHALRYE